MTDLVPSDYSAFVSELVEGLAVETLLYRGRAIDLPVLDSTEDLPFDLAEHAKDANLLLAFYPGGWCPGSREMLRRLERHRTALEGAGARIAAITVELPQVARETARATGAQSPLAVDHAARFSRALGLVRKMPTPVRRQMRDAGIRLEALNGEGSFDLPLPALVVVDRRQRIRWAATSTTPLGLRVADAVRVAAALSSA